MIVVQGLIKTYGGKQVLTDVSFEAANGRVTGFVGPNGAGKSTTMRIIASLEKADSGIALVDGQPFSKAACPGRAMGAYLGNDYLPLHMKAAEYLSYVCKTGGFDGGRIPSVLSMVGLEESANKLIGAYSLGMKQRIGLAAALIGEPSTLMLDEPINGLDPMGVQWLRGVIRSQADAGAAVLLSSHLLSELELVADDVVMLEEGRVACQGSMEGLSARSGPVQVLLHTGDDSMFASALARKGYPVSDEDGMILVSGIPPERLAALVSKVKLDLYHLEEKHPSLEEMFMATARACSAEQPQPFEEPASKNPMQDAGPSTPGHGKQAEQQ